ncbi:MAG: YigZ family protein, partial [bacterium]
MSKDFFLTIETTSSFELKINKSKFISLAIPIHGSSEALSSLSSIKKEYYDAAHRPYAYRTGIDLNN